jgi:hypothetical protein
MSRFTLQIIQAQMEEPDIPDYIMLHKEDVNFLLALIKQAEILAKFAEVAEEHGSLSAKRALGVWRELLINEA